MRCGKCGAEAANASEVRACYDLNGDYTHSVVIAESVSSAMKKFNEDTGLKPVVEAQPFNPPSEKQVDYLLALQDERIIPDGYKVVTRNEAYLMERPTVSSAIELLKFCQKADSGERQPQWTMPEGRYALLHEFGTDNNEDSVWRFYQVDKPAEGRWKGYTFIKRLIGAPGSYRKEPVAIKERRWAMEGIEADPKQAMIDYGLHSGVCGRCSSPLTDPDSLARGIGPVCASKTGWF